MGLRSLPAEPLTVARYLAARAGDGASIATLRLATSAVTKAHGWEKIWNPPAGTRACAPLLRDGEDGWPSPSARPAPSPPPSSP